MRICVYGAASSSIDQEYIEKVEKMGAEMAKRGHSLVFGGGANGLMGAVARGMRKENGRIVGVIPKFFGQESVEEVSLICDELIETETMRERKQVMEDNADGFIVTPGGIGTFEEFFEILTLKQLCRHDKPIALYNIKGYYNEILLALDEATKKNFIRGGCKDLYFASESLEEILYYVETENSVTRNLKDLKEG